MIFSSFTVANDYNFGAQRPNGRGRHFFLPTNKTFDGIYLARAVKSLQKEMESFLYLKSFCKKIIKFSFKLIYEQVN